MLHLGPEVSPPTRPVLSQMVNTSVPDGPCLSRGGAGATEAGISRWICSQAELTLLLRPRHIRDDEETAGIQGED